MFGAQRNHNLTISPKENIYLNVSGSSDIFLFEIQNRPIYEAS